MASERYQRLFKQQSWQNYFSGNEDKTIKGFTQFPDHVLFDQILPRIPQGGSILEVGVGKSLILQKLSGKGFHLSGLDYVESALERTRELCPEANLFQCDLRYDPIPGKYDLIIMNLVLPFLLDEKREYQAEVIKKIRQHCSKFALATHVLLSHSTKPRDYAIQVNYLGFPVNQVNNWLHDAFGFIELLHHQEKMIADWITKEMKDSDIFTYLAY